LRDLQHDLIGLDILESQFHNLCRLDFGSPVRYTLHGWVRAAIHAATLYTPNLLRHRNQVFHRHQRHSTLNLLEGAIEAGVKSFLYTSTPTSWVMRWCRLWRTAAWITEGVTPVPRTSLV
jgi:UDP-glucose 4-epimerase